MSTFLVSVGVGLSTAAILALSAVAFTLEYAVSRVANLAHGEMLTIGAYAAYLTEGPSHNNVAVAAIAAALAGALAGIVINFGLIERFQGHHAITVLIATLGASLILQNLITIEFGAASISYNFTSGGLHHIGPFLWTSVDLEVIGAAIVIAAGIYLLLQKTRLGKSLRAVSQNRELARVSGIPARRVVTQTWLLAGAISGFAGFVLAETIGTFTPTLGFSFLLITITATVAGGLGRPYATLGGAVIVGLIIQIAGTYTSSSYQLVYAFLLLVVLLLVRPNGLFIRSAKARAHRMMYWVTILTESTIFAILAMSLNVIWGWSGDFDLAVYGYFAIGVYTTMVLTVGKPIPPTEYIIGWHLPYPVSVLIAMAVTTAVGALVGWLALRRLREIYFAITTLGAVSALFLVIENYTPLFNGFNGIYGLVNPMNSVLNLSYDGYRWFLLGLCVVILAGVYVVVQHLAGSPFGRMLRSVREDEQAAAVYGRNVFSAKYRAYLLGACLAGLAGGLFAAYLGTFNPSAWTPTEILVLYAAVLVGGRGNARGVILGVYVVYIGFEEMTRYIPSPASRPELGPGLRQILIGLLIILMLRFRPAGIVPERLGLDGVRLRRFFARVSPSALHEPSVEADPALAALRTSPQGAAAAAASAALSEPNADGSPR